MTIFDILVRSATLYPDTTGIIDGARRLTYGHIHDRVRALSAFMAGRGLSIGDRVSILEPNSIAFLEAYFATARDGLILNPLNTRLSSTETRTIIDDAGPRFLIAHSANGDKVRDLLAHRHSIEGIIWTGNDTSVDAEIPQYRYEDIVTRKAADHRDPFKDDTAIAQLYYTSGTTGQPRGVPLSHRNVCSHALSTIAELGIRDSDTWGHFAPMFHLADAWATFAVTWVGGSHVMVPTFSAGDVLSAIENHGVTLSNLVPTMLNDLMADAAARTIADSEMRLILSGGAPIAPALVAKIIEITQCEYVQTYGLTETCPYLTLSTLKSHLRTLPIDRQIEYRAKTGRPMLGVSLRVVDDECRDVVADGKHVGEIVVRGDTVFNGYWNRPRETEQAFVDGWFRTGDLAVMDAEGYINIVDRRKDMIITGGENVYSIEVENILYLHEQVREASVFASPDDHWGEVVTAAVVLKPGATTTDADIMSFCKERLTSFKVPKRVVFLGELPRTGSGKIYKSALRDIVNSNR